MYASPEAKAGNAPDIAAIMKTSFVKTDPAKRCVSIE